MTIESKSKMLTKKQRLVGFDLTLVLHKVLANTKQKLMRMLPLLCLGSLSIFLLACLEVADERAKQEALIGSQTKDNISISVEGGLASIRHLEVSTNKVKLHLWVQAPEVNIHLQRAEQSPQQEIELQISNVLNGSTLFIQERDDDKVVASNEISTNFPSPTVITTQWVTTNTHLNIDLKAPQPEAGQPWQFAVFADVQERIDGLADLLIPLGKEEVRFALISGDLTSMGKRHELEEFQAEMLRHLPFPCYATLGNHELGTEGIPFYYYFGRGSFNFTYGGAMFSLVDGASATLAESTENALDSWLDEGRSLLHIFVTHIPLIDPDGTRGGAFASRLKAAKLLSKLKEYAVDQLIYGHVHTYRNFFQASIPAVISGGGGSIPMRLDGIGRHYLIFNVLPAMQQITHRVQRVYPEE